MKKRQLTFWLLVAALLANLLSPALALGVRVPETVVTSCPMSRRGGKACCCCGASGEARVQASSCTCQLAPATAQEPTSSALPLPPESSALLPLGFILAPLVPMPEAASGACEEQTQVPQAPPRTSDSGRAPPV